jgi:hypothetical protein
MQDRDHVSDEIPVADAVEQAQETTSTPTMPGFEVPPVEANTPDWQEQRQEIVGDDEDDRDEYRE